MRSRHTTFLKLGGMGDIIRLTAALRAYRQSFPEDHIHIITGKTNVAIWANWPYVDSLEFVDDVALFRGSLTQKAAEALKLLQMFRHTDRVFILHRDGRYNALAWLAGVPERFGFGRDKGARFLSHVYQEPEGTNEIDVYLQALSIYPGYVPDGRRLEIFHTTTDAEKATALLTAQWPNWQNKKIIALVPGGAANAKAENVNRRWPLENYAAVAKALVEQGNLVALIGGPGDHAAAEQVIEMAGPSQNIWNSCGALKILETHALLERCHAMVSHDCGPMHIGNAANLPIVALFGATDVRNHAPDQHPLTVSLHYTQDLSCSPCYDKGFCPPCPINQECMRRIKVQEVLDMVAGMLAQ